MRDVERIYAMRQCADGRWLLLNRDYKPFGIGASSRVWFDYDHCDGRRVWLRDRDLRELDGGVARYQQGDRLVFLYHDDTNPNGAYAHLRAYERRLAVLHEEAA